METIQTEKLRRFYNMIAPHIVGHKTASNLFWEVISELEKSHQDSISDSLPSCITCSYYAKFSGQIKGICKKIHYSAPQCDTEKNRISVWNDGFGERVRVPDNYGCVLHKSNDS